MSLQPGQKLAQYEILEPVGAGGMGEVYRARDTKLGRDVAIKVLPEEFAKDRERLDRFEREARLLAQLNHSNVATLHGLEEQEGQQFLVMELVAGETLAERIAQGPLSLEEAIPLFIHIAEGLAAAHEKGIIHRDLKPANIKIAPDGAPKILDFGLAKAFLDGEDPEGDSSQSPTLTKGTALGAIMGTASYMSPEQARGKSVDRRTDTWAFGCCLYEALTAQKAFDGETTTDILAAVVHKEPSWERLSPGVPSDVRRLLRRCFEKDPRERVHDIADARLDLKDARADGAPESPNERRVWPALAAMALVTIAAIGMALWSGTRGSPTSERPVARFTLPFPADHELGISIAGPSVAVSRDGQQLAWQALSDGTSRLYLRSVSELEAQPLDGTDGAFHAFFSPDGRWLGFLTRAGLSKVSVSGGAPVKIADAVGTKRGGVWATDGTIVFSSSDRLYRVSSAGGEPELLAAPVREKREKSLRFPDLIPGSDAVLFTAGSADMETWDEGSIAVLELATGEIRTLVEGGTNARYSATGHIVYARGQRLFAVAFDAGALEVTGAPVAVVEPVSTYPLNGPAQFALSPEGSLVYAPGPVWASTGRVVLLSRRGELESLVETPRPLAGLRVAPDGGRLALGIQGANRSIWTYDMARGVLTPLLSGFNNFDPLWSPDGSALAWSFEGRGVFDIFLVPTDGSGEREQLTPLGGPPARAESWSPDGRFLLYSIESVGTRRDLMVLSLEGDRAPRVFLQTDADEMAADVSPDGAWVAHESDESGRPEIYLRSFPDPAAKYQVSTDGGTDPVWNPRGGELFYQNGDNMMAVDVELNEAPRMGKPRFLFEIPTQTFGRFGSDYDVMPDGERFVITADGETTPRPTSLVVVQNFAEELKRLVPANE